MGEVYLASDPHLLRTVAIKIISGKRKGDREVHERFLREARAASSFSHPNIITIYEMGITDDEVYIVMEYVSGKSLRDQLRTGPLQVGKIIEIALQICSALQEAHSRGLIHRDIKPENVLFTASGQVKLADFGLAKWVDSSVTDSEAPTASNLTRSGALMGTPYYMSPEQLKGLELDHRSDIFSFGILLYEMVSGRLPFSGESALEIAASILKEPFRPLFKNLNEIESGFGDIIERALQKDREKRFGSIVEMQKSLLQLQEELKRDPQSAAVVLERPKATPTRTILTLPLRSVASDEDDILLGVGLARAITTDLTRIRGLTVLYHSGVDLRQDSLEVAREMGARILLEGELMRSGERIAVNARLTDVKTGRVLWGSQFRGNSSDFFSLQDAICRGVAQALQLNVTTDVNQKMGKSGTTNLNAFELFAKGKTLLERRNVRENISSAIETFHDALKLDPQFALAYAELGEAYWRQYQETHENSWVDRAISACDHALILDPNQPQVHISLGVIYLGTGKVDRAIDEFERALQLQPSSDDAHKWLGRCHQRKGDSLSAVVNFEKAIELRPDYWEPYILLGSCLFEAGRYEEAAERFRQAISVAPDNHVGYSNLGAIYYMMGRFQDSIDILKRAIEIQPNSSSFSNLGSAYFRLGKLSEAIDALRISLEKDPRNDVAHRNLGDVFLQVNRTEDARNEYLIATELLKDALKVNPSAADRLARLAIIDAKLGDKSTALTEIEKALVLEPTDPSLMFDSAVVFTLCGDHARALELLRHALSNGYSRSEAEHEPDLQPLHELPEFQKLITR